MISALTGLVVMFDVVGMIAFGALDLPDHRVLAQYQPPLATRLHAADGRLVEEFYIENRVFVPIEAVPPLLAQAFISAEDRNFRRHPGVDPVGLARATLANLRGMASGRRLQGGSTITQQVAKNVFLDNALSLGRKIRELALALRIESDFTKDRILEIYLNQIYLGRGAYGIGAASMRYFGRAPADLSLAQAAYLAALPRAPNNYHPVHRVEAALARRAYVLDRMLEDGAITAAEAAAAHAEPLVVRDRPAPDSVAAPYFSEEVRRHLQQVYGNDALYRGGLSVRTTLDPQLQAIAERALRNGLIAYDRRHGWRGPVANMALIVAVEQAPVPPEPPLPASRPAPIPEPTAEPAAPAAGTPGGGVLGALSGLGDRLGLPALPGTAAPDAAATAPDSAPDSAPGPAPDPRPLWQIALAEIEPPRGTEGWRLAVVLEVRFDQAGIGLDDGSRGRIPFGELRWARPARANQSLGPQVRRAGDVLRVGDVVLVEPTAETNRAETGRAETGRDAPAEYALRQIPAVQGGIVVLDRQSGAVRAMSGGFSYAISEFNRVTQAYRQPGSAFKPFVYLAALEQGYTPSTLLLDVPIEMAQGRNLPRWRPANYNRQFRGMSPLRVGVERSINVMTVRLVEEMGIEPVRDVATAFGIYDDMPLLPAMALGAGETTLLRLTNAYAMIANGGARLRPHLIERIQDRTGRTIFRAETRDCDGCGGAGWRAGQPTPQVARQREQVVDPISAYQMSSILQGVVQRGTAARLAALGRTLAGKTGTTNDVRDAWFVGFSPDLAVGVYVGFDEPRPLGAGESGSGTAVPIFGEFMQEALADRPDRPFPIPPGTVMAWVDRETGYRASQGGSGAILEAFRPGFEPRSAPPATAFGETADNALNGTGGLY